MHGHSSSTRENNRDEVLDLILGGDDEEKRDYRQLLKPARIGQDVLKLMKSALPRFLGQKAVKDSRPF